jgi:hypothetical protein
MMYYNLIIPFLLTWGTTTALLLILSLTDTCDAESMFSRRNRK